MLIDDQCARHAEFSGLGIRLNELLLVFCPQHDFRTATRGVAIILGDLSMSQLSLGETIAKCVSSLSSQFSSRHIKIAADNSVLVKVIV